MADRPPDVWVTRAEPGAAVTAQRLRDRGWAPLPAPLLAVRPVAGEIDLAGVGAVAFTSANAVAAVEGRGVPAALPVFAVGDATADAARAAGFDRVASAGGDVGALAALVRQRRPDVSGVLLHPCAAETAGDLPGLLAGAIEVRQVVVYETVALPRPIEAERAWRGLAAVLLHSPKAARLFAAATHAWPRGPALLCLSPAVAEALGGVCGPVLVAERPEESALLNLLDVHSPGGDGRG